MIEDRETPSDAAKHFYVSAIDGPKRALVAGPYASHAEALDKVDAARLEAERREFKLCPFIAWGTAGSPEEFKTVLGVI